MQTRFVPAILFLFVSPSFAQTPATQPARYPDLAQARQIMTADTPYPYLSRLQPMEMSAKTGKPITGDTPEARQTELRSRYSAAVQEFTPEEKQTLDWFVTMLDPLVADYPLYAKTPWQFIKVDASLESGASHTRSGAIVFTANTLRRLTTVRTVASGLSPDRSIGAVLGSGGLLLHEKSHVIQRQHPKVVADLFTTVWGFQYAPNIDMGDWLTRHQLLNPDGSDLHWVYKLPPNPVAGEGAASADHYILPMVAFGPNAPDAPTNFAAFSQLAIDLDKTATGFAAHLDATGKPTFQPINRVPAYANQFAPATSRYHPNEILADLFAALIVSDTLAKQAHQPLNDAKPLGPLRTWLTTHFNQYAPPEVPASQSK